MFKINSRKIRELIVERGWTCRELARQSGLCEQTCQRLARGVKAAIQGRLVNRLAAALGVAVSEILSEEV